MSTWRYIVGGTLMGISGLGLLAIAVFGSGKKDNLEQKISNEPIITMNAGRGMQIQEKLDETTYKAFITGLYTPLKNAYKEQLQGRDFNDNEMLQLIERIQRNYQETSNTRNNASVHDTLTYDMVNSAIARFRNDQNYFTIAITEEAQLTQPTTYEPNGKDWSPWGVKGWMREMQRKRGVEQ